jgi:serine/threonine-protein kinase
VIAGVEASPGGVSWEEDGTILFAVTEGILRVSANGGVPDLIIPAEGGTVAYGPRLLPDGDSVLFSVATTDNWDAAQIVAQSLSTGERTVLVEGGSDARYLPTGHLVYALGDGLFAVAFDLDSLTVSGGAVPLLQGVMRAVSAATAAANYGVSEDGTLVYVKGGDNTVARRLVWVDRAGRETLLGAPPRAYNNARISPDGTMVALDVRDQDRDIWTWDLARETLTRLTFDPGEDEFPVWSPDGRRIAFSSSRGGGSPTDTSLFWRAADGTGSSEQLAERSGQIFPTSFLPDATELLVYGGFSDTATNDDIALFRLEGGDPLTPLLETSFGESYPQVSPDGRWLAYVSDESGRDEIYVRPFPEVDAGGRWQVSTGGGTQPLWARNGRELFYRTVEAVIAVPIETDPNFRQGNPEVVFEGNYHLFQGGPNYDVSPDGERFLMIRQDEGASSTSQIIVVQNWFEELERLAPTVD